MDWPKVTIEHIRPAGPQSACLYCQSLIGMEHKRDCVMVTKRVKVRFTIELETDEPHSWDGDQIEFHYNEGSWCFDNIINLIDRQQIGCLCNVSTAKFVEVVDETPRVVD